MDNQIKIKDAPRLTLTLSFIEGIGVSIYVLRQLSYGGPYGPFLGLTLGRFIFLLTIVLCTIALGILISNQNLQNKAVGSRLLQLILLQTKLDVLLIILGGSITGVAIGAFFAFNDIQYRVISVVVGYFGLIIFQAVISRFYINNFFKITAALDSHLWNNQFVKRAKQPILIAGYVLVFSLGFWYRLSSEGANVFDLGINLYVVLYLIQFIIISLGLGVVMIRLDQWLLVPAVSRFWIGFCATPFIIGSWVLGLATLFPGIDRLAFTLTLPIIAIFIIVIWGSKAFSTIREEIQSDQTNHAPKTLIILYLVAALVFGAVIATLILNGRYKVIDRDALRYLAEGLAIAQNDSLEYLPMVKDSNIDILFGDRNGFMFPAILSNALLINGRNSPGYPHDEAARFSFQLLIAYMFLSIFALTSIIRKKGTGIITLLMFMGVPTLGVLSYGSYRDPLRILSYFLVAVVLVGLSPQNLKTGISWKPLIILMIIAGFCISSHGASVLIAAMLMLAWLVWHLLYYTKLTKISLVGISFLIGCLIGGLYIIQGYMQTGTPVGLMAEDILKINELTPGIERAFESFGNADSLTLTQGLTSLYARDDYRLSTIGLIAILLTLLLWFRNRKDETINQILFLGLLTFTITLPFLGVFDSKYYQWSKSYVYNYRYSLHWYPFAATCAAMLATSTGVWIKTEWMKKFINGLILLIAAFYAILSYQTIIANWAVQHENTADRVAMDHNISLHEKMITMLTTGKRLLINDQIYNYYLNNQAILYLTPPTRDIAQAHNVQEVKNGIDKLKIGAAVLYQDIIFDYYDKTALYEYLDNPHNAYLYAQNQDLRAYINDPILVSEHNASLMEAKTKFQEALSSYEQHQLEKTTSLYQEAIGLFPDVIKTLSQDEVSPIIDLVGFITHQYETYHLGISAGLPLDTNSTQLPSTAINLAQGSITFRGKFENSDISNLKLIQVNSNSDLTLILSNSNGIHYLYYYYHDQLVGRVLVTLPDEAYHYFVLTWYDGVQMMFIDGEQVMFSNYPANLNITDTININWMGNLTNATFYNHALSTDEIFMLSKAK